ncbi:predicted protein [Naegleria gruberi]|uniref:Predicted protein n=1 Tax=Naegleria gruberi TaxID=5762 RepID=D2VVE5_NAEGR|nr:uncharacterized protein NAEGRDRAFT_72988 [Naegleria gruberi]EFC39297.1 predicted protein [Naegleria gruberi]|eukprot:XP_002672041.1 predicted protein [Naegleria gruberi strain NEG-M]
MRQSPKGMEQTIWTIAGNGIKGFYGDNGLAIEAKLSSPYGVAVNPYSNDVYIADYRNHCIRKVSALDNKITTIAGTGVAGYSGDGGLALHAQLNCPLSVSIHPKNEELYIADYSNHRIRKISLTYGTISTVAGNNTGGTSGDGGLALFAQLYFPQCVKIHPITFDIYIIDFVNNKIRRISNSSGIISTFAGNGTAGFCGEGGFATNAQLNGPSGLDFNPTTGDVYIADSNNHRVRKVNCKSGIITTLAGTGKAGYSDGIDAQLNYPYDVSFCTRGQIIYVTDRSNNRICTVSPIDGRITTVCGINEKGFDGDGGLAINAKISSPCQIAVHAKNGDVYFSDFGNNRIRKIVGSYHATLLKPLSFKLKKYDRDLVDGTNLICCKSVFNILAPHFSKSIVFNSFLLKHLTSTQMEIIQHLIDSIMYQQYHDSEWFDKYELVDILAILGMSKGFTSLKRKLVDEFTKSFSQSCAQLVSKNLEKVTQAKDSAPLFIDNPLLDQLLDYCIGHAAKTMQQSASAVDIPIFQKHLVPIAKKLSTTINPITINDDETSDKTTKSVETLFNDKATSDITIKTGTKEFYAHKTILASNSPYYEALFNSGFEYQDLKDDIYVIDTEEFSEDLHEIVLKYCYGVFDVSSVPINQALPLFKCFALYDVKEMIDYYLNNLQITIDNFCTLFEQLGNYNDSVYERLINFGRNTGKTFNRGQG